MNCCCWAASLSFLSTSRVDQEVTIMITCLVIQRYLQKALMNPPFAPCRGEWNRQMLKVPITPNLILSVLILYEKIVG